MASQHCGSKILSEALIHHLTFHTFGDDINTPILTVHLVSILDLPWNRVVIGSSSGVVNDILPQP